MISCSFGGSSSTGWSGDVEVDDNDDETETSDGESGFLEKLMGL